MLSDGWLRLGYRHDDSVSLDAAHIANFYTWYDHEGNPVGATVNFEYANDSHYEMNYENWLRFLIAICKSDDLAQDAVTILRKYFDTHNMIDFEILLRKQGIRYDVISFTSYSDD